MKENSTLPFEPRGNSTEQRAAATSIPAGSRESIVEKAVRIRMSMGDAVNDEQFTHLAGRFLPPQKDGFSFACFSDGCVILNVPLQALSDWYPGAEWISSRKEQFAKKIADRFELTVCEPPDRRDYIVPPAATHHHLEMISQCESVVVAHPLFLKIRVFAENNNIRFWARHEKLPDPGELFDALKPLYTNEPR